MIFIGYRRSDSGGHWTGPSRCWSIVAAGGEEFRLTAMPVDCLLGIESASLTRDRALFDVTGRRIDEAFAPIDTRQSSDGRPRRKQSWPG